MIDAFNHALNVALDRACIPLLMVTAVVVAVAYLA